MKVRGRGEHWQPHLGAHTDRVVVVSCAGGQHHVLTLHQMLQHERGLCLGEVLVVREPGVELVGDTIGVTPPVRHQVAFVNEILGTEVTVVGSVHGHPLLMTALVEHEVSLESERLATVCADVGTVPGVCAEVLQQAGLVIERFCTNDTIELGAGEMLTQMSLQMLLAGESAVTELARVGRFTCMNADMTS